MMRRPAARGPAFAGFGALLGLLVAVVALLCVSRQAGRAEHGVAQTGFSVGAEQVRLQGQASRVAEGDVSAPPCGKKAVLEQSAPRADGHSPVAVASCPSPREPASTPRSAFGSRPPPAGPAPPSPLVLLSVLRI
ncbi:predicted protein [Streptomyces viridosporus ATCC 14672]|uniref:Flp pilus-assembly TadG-like N-terminal domain-containing protein n=2 Tax=Streptomyces viridosporus TaxID=67581 RepID=A0ABX6AK74_STRVD|nr:predicted protein [Streptomyces viridosporus ATCC 14672]QEU88259.1 hypothetical protein CP969_28895 [Streptomyces viridosporus T7A]